MERDVIPLVDKDGRLLANKVQLLRITTWPPGMEAQVHYRLTTKLSRRIGLVENGIQGDTGVAVAATVCRPTGNRQTASSIVYIFLTCFVARSLY